MKIAKTMVFAASALALAVGSAYAADDKKKNDPGFNALDKDNNGALSRAEAGANPDLANRFKDADRNADGKLTRSEYLMFMGKKDLGAVKEKAENVVQGRDRSSASSGTSAAVAREDRNDPNFNALDKDNDGSLTRAEATGNADLVRKFKQADKNADGKLSRAEYLAVMGKKDARAAKEKAQNAVRSDRSSSTGASDRGTQREAQPK